jgi:hypothetical protein
MNFTSKDAMEVDLVDDTPTCHCKLLVFQLTPHYRTHVMGTCRNDNELYGLYR